MAIEIVVFGTPISLQAKSSAKSRWQELVRRTARERVAEDERLEGKPLAAALLYFYFDDTLVDLDNIAKPILDALTAIAYDDDRRLVNLSLRKTNLRDLEIRDPSPMLAEAVEHASMGERDFVYVRVTDDAVDHSRLPWDDPAP